MAKVQQDEKEKFYIFQAIHPITLVLKPSRKVFSRNGQDVIATKQIALRFGQDLCAHVDNDLVEDTPYSVEDVRRMVEKTPNFYHHEIRLLYDSSSGDPVPVPGESKELGLVQGAVGLGGRARA